MKANRCALFFPHFSSLLSRPLAAPVVATRQLVTKLLPALILISFLTVASLLAADDNPAELIRAARERVLQNAARLPRYTCVQTIKRSLWTPAGIPRGGSCPATPDEKLDQLRADDRLRLDVAVGDGREIFSWAGDRQFSNQEIDDLVGFGPLGTGDFGSFILSIFDPNGPLFLPSSQRIVEGRRQQGYRFEVPRERSSYRLRARTGTFLMSYEGEVWIDIATRDLVEMQIKVTNPPAGTELCDSRSRISYRRIQLGAGTFLLPQRTTLDIRYRPSGRSRNETDYTQCREYTGQVTLRFDAPDTIAPPATPSPLKALPEGTRFKVQLEELLDSEKSAAGDVVHARVTAPVYDERKQLLIPRGTRVRGRIAQMIRMYRPNARFAVGIRMEEMETPEGHVAIEVIAPKSPARTGAFVHMRPGQLLPSFTRSDVQVFYLGGRNGRLRERGLQMEWQIAPLSTR